MQYTQKHGHKSTYMQNPHQFIAFQKKGKGYYLYLKHASQILPTTLPEIDESCKNEE
jgi:hypothetical protein